MRETELMYKQNRQTLDFDAGFFLKRASTLTDYWAIAALANCRSWRVQ